MVYGCMVHDKDESGISVESNIESNIVEISNTNRISKKNIQWHQVRIEY